MGELLDGASSPHGGDGSAAGTAPGSPEPTPAAPALPPHLEPVRVAAVQESRRLATRFTALAPSFHDPDSDDVDEDAAEAELLSVALALRCTRTVADRIVRDAHVATTHLPRTLERLGGGEFPAAWYKRTLRRTRHLHPGPEEAVGAGAAHRAAPDDTEQC